MKSFVKPEIEKGERMHGKLADYAFVKSPDADTEFIVERDGTVWKPGPKVEWTVWNRKKNVVFDWREFLGGGAKWHYEQDAPVLHLADGDGELVFFVFRGKGYCIAEDGAFELESKTPVSDAGNMLSSVRREMRARLEYAANLHSGNIGLDRVIRTSLMLAEATFTGSKPRYGSGAYGCAEHEGFPPTVIRMTECLELFGAGERAREIFCFYLENFVSHPDGVLKYYGPSLAEYGMLLDMGTRLFEGLPESARIHCDELAGLLVRKFECRNELDAATGLPVGVPEADEVNDKGVFSHNSAWCARGLKKWGASRENNRFFEFGAALEARLKDEISKFKQVHGFIPFRFDGDCGLPEKFCLTRQGSYANYRYYPELLESGILTKDEAAEVIAYRHERGGDYNGVTLFYTFPEKVADYGEWHYDDWTLMSYANALAHYGFAEEYRRVFAGHLALHVEPETFIAYEQVTHGNGMRRAYADYCVPCELVLPGMFAAAPHGWLDNLPAL